MLTSRQPARHAGTHQDGGTDEIATATPAANAIPKAGAGGTLAVGWLPGMGASGAGHAAGAVPDPGAVAGSSRFLREDATWAAPGGGTVTSVALTMPAEFSVSGSPVTSSGTLAVAKANQNPNLVYAGPGTGAAAAPAFRALVAADLALADGQIPESIGGVLTGIPLPHAIFDFRLTPSSGTPIVRSDVTGATSLYLSPHKGNCVGLHDGTRWKLYRSSELTLALGTLVTYQAYDVFLHANAGTLTLEKLEWANATVTMTIASPGVITWTSHGMSTGQSITFTTSGALPTGVSANTPYFVTVVDANTFKLSTSRANVAASTFVNTSGSQSGTHAAHQPQARQTALTTQDGVPVKSGDSTRRYVGSFLADSTTTTQMSFGGINATPRLLIWNLHHPVAMPCRVYETTNSWTYSTNAWRQANAGAGNQIELIAGLPISPLKIFGEVAAVHSIVGQYGSIGIGEDATNATAAENLIGVWQCNSTSGSLVACTHLDKVPALGFHAYLWLERGNGTATATWLSSDSGGSPNGRVFGLSGSWWC